MKNDEKILTFYIVSNHSQAKKLLYGLKKKGYDISRCAICNTKIHNRVVKRPPHTRMEKFLAKYFHKEYMLWDCNWGNPVHSTKEVVCDNMGCIFEAGMQERMA